MLLLIARHKVDTAHVFLYDLANSCDEARHVAPADPAAALGIEDGGKFFRHKRYVATSPENSTDHPGQCHHPGVVFQVFRIDEDLERPTAPISNDVVDRHIERVVAARPFQLISIALKRWLAFEGLGHVMDCGGLDRGLWCPGPGSRPADFGLGWCWR